MRSAFWTEERIERWVERRMDQLDLRLLRGAITQKQYDFAVADLDRFAREMSSRRKRPTEDAGDEHPQL